MTLFVPVTITPETLDALYSLSISLEGMKGHSMEKRQELSVLHKFIGYAKGEVYKAWKELPEGSHLKAAYLDDVWSWDDGDIAENRNAPSLPKEVTDGLWAKFFSGMKQEEEDELTIPV
jgi:hypothetical protein